MKRVFLSIIVYLCCLSGISQSLSQIQEFTNAAHACYKAIQTGNKEEVLYWIRTCEGMKTSDAYTMSMNAALAYSYQTGTITWFMKEQTVLEKTTPKSVGLYSTNIHISQDWALSVEYFSKAIKAYPKSYPFDPIRRSFCLQIGKMYETGGPNLQMDLNSAIKWYKKGLSFDDNKFYDDTYMQCEKSLARLEQNRGNLASTTKKEEKPLTIAQKRMLDHNKNSVSLNATPMESHMGQSQAPILASSSTSSPKQTKEEKPVKVETPQPKQDVAVVEKTKQQVEHKVVQTPTAPKKEIFPVDVSIPNNSKKADYTYVLIIANENYQDVENVRYALNDGRIFKEYCEKTLGIPASNIRIKEDATLNNIISGVDWLKSICEASNGKGKCIFYYSGHGIPDESTQSSYILPVDGTGKNIRTGYSLNELYTSLGELPVESATMFIDACFSGANRGNNMLVAARGVAIKAKLEAPKGKLVVFSAAQSDETAFPYEDAKHGMFTYFLLRKLKETKGNCSLSELGEYLKENVTRTAILENDKPQTPAISVSPLMESVWRGIMLK